VSNVQDIINQSLNASVNNTMTHNSSMMTGMDEDGDWDDVNLEESKAEKKLKKKEEKGTKHLQQRRCDPLGSEPLCADCLCKYREVEARKGTRERRKRTRKERKEGKRTS
jgi:hypothetical protein